jgi:hypothetical protein
MEGGQGSDAEMGKATLVTDRGEQFPLHVVTVSNFKQLAVSPTF